MDDELSKQCEQLIRERLRAAGAGGLTTTGLKLPGAGTKRGKACRQVLGRMVKSGDVGNLGSAARPRYVLPEHFKPVEIAAERIEKRARQAGVRLGSRNTLTKGLTGAVGKKVDDALKRLVEEGVLVRLKWAGRPLYVHASALSRTSRPEGEAQAKDTASPGRGAPDDAAIRRAYRETVNEFGYPDVLIHEVYLRLGGELEPFKDALMQACRSGRAVPSIGDWSLSSPEERSAALYINGRPHLRIRLKE